MNKVRRAELYLTLITILWGGTFVSIKMTLDYTSPMILLGLRFLFAFLFFIILFPVHISSISKTLIWRGLILGFVMYLGYGLQTLGLNFTTASRAGFITYFYALLVPLFQWLIIKKVPLWTNIAGLVLAFIGLSLITGGLAAGTMNKGDFITLVSAASFSFYLILLTLWTNEDNSRVLTAFQLLVTAICGFLSSPFLEDPFLISHPLLWGNLLYLSFFGSVIAVYVMTRYQNLVTPTRAAILYSLEPVFSVIAAVLILGEHFSLLQSLGSALIIAGVLFSEFMETKSAK